MVGRSEAISLPGSSSGRDVDRYAGVNASLVLPMTPTFQPDLPALRRYARWIGGQGVIAVTVNADTGEGAHLTFAERVAVVEEVKRELRDDVRVVSGLVASYTEQAVELATSLRDAGADALLVFSIPAFTGRPLAPEVVYDYYARVADVGLPLIAFSLTATLGGVVFEPAVIDRLAGLGAVAALKEASFDATTYVTSRDVLREAAPDIALLSGCDNFMFESFLLGADGALLGYAGLAAQLTRDMFDAVHAGRSSTAEQLSRERADPLARVLFGAPVRNSRARIKAGLRLLGVLEHDVVRPPLPQLDENERLAVRGALEQAGLL